MLNRYRHLLMSQIDGAKVAPLLPESVLPRTHLNAIISDQDIERRTAMLLDWLETKSTDAYHAFVDAIGELYPHIYLELTGSGQDDDGTLANYTASQKKTAFLFNLELRQISTDFNKFW